jgi:hypothetical protein
MKHKAIGIQSKPKVDVASLDEQAEEEEAKAEKIAEDIENPEETPESPLEVKPEVPETEVPPVPTVDYKKKYTESQKEAMILKKKLEQKEEESKKLEITDDYMIKNYPDWGDMTPTEQLALKKAEILNQEVEELKQNANRFNNDREWLEKVELFIADDLADLFPKIIGREEDFKRFATRPTRKGLPLDDLAKVYLYENPPIETKRTLFHAPGSAGATPEAEGMSAEDIKTLRIQKPLEWMRLVRAGKIKVKI